MVVIFLDRLWVDLIKSQLQNFLWMPQKRLGKSSSVSGVSTKPHFPVPFPVSPDPLTSNTSLFVSILNIAFLLMLTTPSSALTVLQLTLLFAACCMRPRVLVSFINSK